MCLFVGQALQFAGCKTRGLIDMPFGGTRVGPRDHVLRKGALYGAYTLHLIDLHLTHIQRLQSVQNAAARLIFNLRRCDHVTDALVSLSLLVPRAGGSYIQGGDADVSCSAWFRTTLLGVVIHMCRRHAAPTQAQVRLH